MRGRHAVSQFKHWRPPGEFTPKPISPSAIRVYRRMRRHEREQGGPGGDEWWAMNRELARCLGLFEGMTVYEDPEWRDPRSSRSALDRFFVLERAARPRRKYKYKWQR